MVDAVIRTTAKRSKNSEKEFRVRVDAVILKGSRVLLLSANFASQLIENGVKLILYLDRGLGLFAHF